MASINFYQTDEIGNGLQLLDGNLNLKLDNTGNVNLTTSADGLKADVTLPEAQVALTDGSINDRTITFNKTDGSTITIELPALPIDVSLANAELTEENKLKLTLSDGTIKEVELATLIPAPKTTEQILDEILADDALKAKLVSGIYGREIRNAHNELLGYALPVQAGG